MATGNRRPATRVATGRPRRWLLGAGLPGVAGGFLATTKDGAGSIDHSLAHLLRLFFDLAGTHLHRFSHTLGLRRHFLQASLDLLGRLPHTRADAGRVAADD